MIGHIYPNWQSMIGLPHLHQEGRELLLLNLSMSQSIYNSLGYYTHSALQFIIRTLCYKVAVETS